MQRTRARNQWVNSCCVFVGRLHFGHRARVMMTMSVFKARREAVIPHVFCLRSMELWTLQRTNMKSCESSAAESHHVYICPPHLRCKKLFVDLQQAGNESTHLVIIPSRPSETMTFALSLEGKGSAALDEQLSTAARHSRWSRGETSRHISGSGEESQT